METAAEISVLQCFPWLALTGAHGDKDAKFLYSITVGMCTRLLIERVACCSRCRRMEV